MREILLATVLAISAGAAQADEQTFDLQGFSKVEAGFGLDVTIAMGDYSISAEGDARALDRLEVARHGDTLKLTMKPRGWERFSPITWLFGQDDDLNVTIALPELRSVAALSGADVEVDGATGGRFEAKSRSGADLKIDSIAAQDVMLDASSGATLNISGTCGSVAAGASSGAEINAKDLICDEGRLAVSSGADISLNARTVMADAAAGGSADVWGVEELDSSASSGGEVTRH